MVYERNLLLSLLLCLPIPFKSLLAFGPQIIPLVSACIAQPCRMDVIANTDGHYPYPNLLFSQFRRTQSSNMYGSLDLLTMLCVSPATIASFSMQSVSTLRELFNPTATPLLATFEYRPHPDELETLSHAESQYASVLATHSPLTKPAFPHMTPPNSANSPTPNMNSTPSSPSVDLTESSDVSNDIGYRPVRILAEIQQGIQVARGILINQLNPPLSHHDLLPSAMHDKEWIHREATSFLLCVVSGLMECTPLSPFSTRRTLPPIPLDPSYTPLHPNPLPSTERHRIVECSPTQIVASIDSYLDDYFRTSVYKKACHSILTSHSPKCASPINATIPIHPLIPPFTAVPAKSRTLHDGEHMHLVSSLSGLFLSASYPDRPASDDVASLLRGFAVHFAILCGDSAEHSGGFSQLAVTPGEAIEAYPYSYPGFRPSHGAYSAFVRIVCMSLHPPGSHLASPVDTSTIQPIVFVDAMFQALENLEIESVIQTTLPVCALFVRALVCFINPEFEPSKLHKLIHGKHTFVFDSERHWREKKLFSRIRQEAETKRVLTKGSPLDSSAFATLRYIVSEATNRCNSHSLDLNLSGVSFLSILVNHLPFEELVVFLVPILSALLTTLNTAALPTGVSSVGSEWPMDFTHRFETVHRNVLDDDENLGDPYHLSLPHSILHQSCEDHIHTDHKWNANPLTTEISPTFVHIAARDTVLTLLSRCYPSEMITPLLSSLHNGEITCGFGGVPHLYVLYWTLDYLVQSLASASSFKRDTGMKGIQLLGRRWIDVSGQSISHTMEDILLMAYKLPSLSVLLQKTFFEIEPNHCPLPPQLTCDISATISRLLTSAEPLTLPDLSKSSSGMPEYYCCCISPLLGTRNGTELISENQLDQQFERIIPFFDTVDLSSLTLILALFEDLVAFAAEPLCMDICLIIVGFIGLVYALCYSRAIDVDFMSSITAAAGLLQHANLIHCTQAHEKFNRHLSTWIQSDIDQLIVANQPNSGIGQRIVHSMSLSRLLFLRTQKVQLPQCELGSLLQIICENLARYEPSQYALALHTLQLFDNLSKDAIRLIHLSSISILRQHDRQLLHQYATLTPLHHLLQSLTEHYPDAFVESIVEQEYSPDNLDFVESLLLGVPDGRFTQQLLNCCQSSRFLSPSDLLSTTHRDRNANIPGLVTEELTMILSYYSDMMSTNNPEMVDPQVHAVIQQCSTRLKQADALISLATFSFNDNCDELVALFSDSLVESIVTLLDLSINSFSSTMESKVPVNIEYQFWGAFTLVVQRVLYSFIKTHAQSHHIDFIEHQLRMFVSSLSSEQEVDDDLSGHIPASQDGKALFSSILDYINFISRESAPTFENPGLQHHAWHISAISILGSPLSFINEEQSATGLYPRHSSFTSQIIPIVQSFKDDINTLRYLLSALLTDIDLLHLGASSIIVALLDLTDMIALSSDTLEVKSLISQILARLLIRLDLPTFRNRPDEWGQWMKLVNDGYSFGAVMSWTSLVSQRHSTIASPTQDRHGQPSYSSTCLHDSAIKWLHSAPSLPLLIRIEAAFFELLSFYEQCVIGPQTSSSLIQSQAQQILCACQCYVSLIVYSFSYPTLRKIIAERIFPSSSPYFLLTKLTIMNENVSVLINHPDFSMTNEEWQQIVDFTTSPGYMLPPIAPYVMSLHSKLSRNVSRYLFQQNSLDSAAWLRPIQQTQFKTLQIDWVKGTLRASLSIILNKASLIRQQKSTNFVTPSIHLTDIDIETIRILCDAINIEDPLFLVSLSNQLLVFYSFLPLNSHVMLKSICSLTRWYLQYGDTNKDILAFFTKQVKIFIAQFTELSWFLSLADAFDVGIYRPNPTSSPHNEIHLHRFVLLNLRHSIRTRLLTIPSFTVSEQQAFDRHTLELNQHVYCQHLTLHTSKVRNHNQVSLSDSAVEVNTNIQQLFDMDSSFMFSFVTKVSHGQLLGTIYSLSLTSYSFLNTLSLQFESQLWNHYSDHDQIAIIRSKSTTFVNDMTSEHFQEALKGTQFATIQLALRQLGASISSTPRFADLITPETPPSFVDHTNEILYPYSIPPPHLPEETCSSINHGARPFNAPFFASSTALTLPPSFVGRLAMTFAALETTLGYLTLSMNEIHDRGRRLRRYGSVRTPFRQAITLRGHKLPRVTEEGLEMQLDRPNMSTNDSTDFRSDSEIWGDHARAVNLQKRLDVLDDILWLDEEFKDLSESDQSEDEDESEDEEYLPEKAHLKSRDTLIESFLDPLFIQHCDRYGMPLPLPYFIDLTVPSNQSLHCALLDDEEEWKNPSDETVVIRASLPTLTVPSHRNSPLSQALPVEDLPTFHQTLLFPHTSEITFPPNTSCHTLDQTLFTHPEPVLFQGSSLQQTRDVLSSLFYSSLLVGSVMAMCSQSTNILYVPRMVSFILFHKHRHFVTELPARQRYNTPRYANPTSLTDLERQAFVPPPFIRTASENNETTDTLCSMTLPKHLLDFPQPDNIIPEQLGLGHFSADETTQRDYYFAFLNLLNTDLLPGFQSMTEVTALTHSLRNAIHHTTEYQLLEKLYMSLYEHTHSDEYLEKILYYRITQSSRNNSAIAQEATELSNGEFQLSHASFPPLMALLLTILDPHGEPWSRQYMIRNAELVLNAFVYKKQLTLTNLPPFNTKSHCVVLNQMNEISDLQSFISILRRSSGDAPLNDDRITHDDVWNIRRAWLMNAHSVTAVSTLQDQSSVCRANILLRLAFGIGLSEPTLENPLLLRVRSTIRRHLKYIDPQTIRKSTPAGRVYDCVVKPTSDLPQFLFSFQNSLDAKYSLQTILSSIHESNPRKTQFVAEALFRYRKPNLAIVKACEAVLAKPEDWTAWRDLTRNLFYVFILRCCLPSDEYIPRSAKPNREDGTIPDSQSHLTLEDGMCSFAYATLSLLRLHPKGADDWTAALLTTLCRPELNSGFPKIIRTFFVRDPTPHLLINPAAWVPHTVPMILSVNERNREFFTHALNDAIGKYVHIVIYLLSSLSASINRQATSVDMTVSSAPALSISQSSIKLIKSLSSSFSARFHQTHRLFDRLLEGIRSITLPSSHVVLNTVDYLVAIWMHGLNSASTISMGDIVQKISEHLVDLVEQKEPTPFNFVLEKCRQQCLALFDFIMQHQSQLHPVFWAFASVLPCLFKDDQTAPLCTLLSALHYFSVWRDLLAKECPSKIELFHCAPLLKELADTFSTVSIPIPGIDHLLSPSSPPPLSLNEDTREVAFLHAEQSQYQRIKYVPSCLIHTLHSDVLFVQRESPFSFFVNLTPLSCGSVTASRMSVPFGSTMSTPLLTFISKTNTFHTFAVYNNHTEHTPLIVPSVYALAPFVSTQPAFFLQTVGGTVSRSLSRQVSQNGLANFELLPRSTTALTGRVMHRTTPQWHGLPIGQHKPHDIEEASINLGHVHADVDHIQPTMQQAITRNTTFSFATVPVSVPIGDDCILVRDLSEGVTISEVAREWGANLRTRSRLPTPTTLQVEEMGQLYSTIHSLNTHLPLESWISTCDSSLALLHTHGLPKHFETSIRFVLAQRGLSIHHLALDSVLSPKPSIPLCCKEHALQPALLKAKMRMPQDFLEAAIRRRLPMPEFFQPAMRSLANQMGIGAFFTYLCSFAPARPSSLVIYPEIGSCAQTVWNFNDPWGLTEADLSGNEWWRLGLSYDPLAQLNHHPSKPPTTRFSSVRIRCSLPLVRLFGDIVTGGCYARAFTHSAESVTETHTMSIFDSLHELYRIALHTFAPSPTLSPVILSSVGLADIVHPSQEQIHSISTKLVEYALARAQMLSPAEQLRRDQQNAIDTSSYVVIHSALHQDYLSSLPWWWFPWM
ncbi:hypothetical protein BLNAU_1657 [Blattamonas nauphoetae]|uniref:Uncharacterized protein n=1 Tax=Blattamonas nauphoetae TaxID=2049346 RepID=A0ABQ9YHQ4_9EUKA|nr:hypothetical protein BLNAU_1657 [Blattamonas nauphoetae]